ncbi:MAG TPA: hypothetical protein VN515_05005 [Terriglobales bacterium]|nr:hypothetical protein [Terriglobales bacterium]
MRTTLAIDDSTYQRLQAEMHRRGTSFRQVVNECLRLGLDALRHPRRQTRFVVQPSPGGPRPGINIDKIAELLDDDGGPWSR